MPYAKDHTQIYIKDTIINAIKKIEGFNSNENENNNTCDLEFYPYLDLSSDIPLKSQKIKSLISKFYDEEQNLVENGSKKIIIIIIITKIKTKI